MIGVYKKYVSEYNKIGAQNINDETLMDDTYIKYPMSAEVERAINTCLHDTPLDQDSIYHRKLLTPKPWEDLNNNVNPDIEYTCKFYKELLKDAEVIPYTYALESDTMCGSYWKGVGSPTCLMTFGANVPFNPGNAPYAKVATGMFEDEDGKHNVYPISTTTYEENFDGIGAGFQIHIENDTKYPINSYIYQGIYKYNGAADGKVNFLPPVQLIRKTSAINDIVLSPPKTMGIQDAKWWGTMDKAYMLNEIEEDLDQYCAIPRRYGFIYDPVEKYETFKQEYSAFNIQSGSLMIYNNTNENAVTTENPRSLCAVGAHRYAGSISRKEGYGNKLVFFVKCPVNYLNDDGSIYNPQTDEEIEKYPGYVYIMFNAQSLYASSYLTEGRRYHGWDWDYKQSNPYSGIDAPPGNDYGYTKLGIQSTGRNDSGDPIHTWAYLTSGITMPFNYFIKRNANYFQKTNFFQVQYQGVNFGSGTKPDDYVPDLYDPFLVYNMGYIPMSEDLIDEIVQFHVYGLGVKMAKTEIEATTKTTDEWSSVLPPEDPSNPNSPDNPNTQPHIPGDNDSYTNSGDGDREAAVTITSGHGAGNASLLSTSWIMDRANVEKLQAQLTNTDLWNAISNMFKDDPREGLINLHRYPIDISNIWSLSDTNVTILDNEIETVQGTRASADLPTQFSLGTFRFKPHFGNFLDYKYTKITIYLPFIGYKELSTDLVMGRTISVKYYVNWADGGLTAVIRTNLASNAWSGSKTIDPEITTVNDGDPGVTPIYTFTGTIGQRISLSTSDFQSQTSSAAKSLLSGLVSGVVTIGVGAATGGTGLVAGALAGTALSAGMQAGSIAAYQPSYSPGGGAIGATDGYATSTEPFIIIERPNRIIPDSYGRMYGYPIVTDKRLSGLKGFTVVSNPVIPFIDKNGEYGDKGKTFGINCTDDEMREIKDMLKTGIYIK